MPGFIDGQTREDGYIMAGECEDTGSTLYEALSFSYRPAAKNEWVALDATIRQISFKGNDSPESAVKAENEACKFVASPVKAWDLKAAGVHDVEITTDNCSKLHPKLFNQLYRIIRGSRGNDKKPDADTEPKTDEEITKN